MFKSAFQGHGSREGGGDAGRGRDGRGRGDFPRPAANDNGRQEAPIEDAAMRLARLLGRQIAREQLARPEAANDNAPDTEAHER